MKITMEDLRYQLKVLNELTSNDKYPYVFYIAYGSYGLCKIVNDCGGERTIINLTTKKDLYNQMTSLIKGIEIARESDI